METDGNLLTYLLGLAVFGLIAGAVGRLLVPGPNPLGCFGTMAAGVAGSFLAGLVGRLLFGQGYTAGWIASILGAAVVVYLVARYGRSRRRPYV
ncbi:MAG: GlsB/YeaQ/YmgE family stress response membrane protein [Actinomycetota bacterium]|nr:GlsB/YeaQ/YmgE family stress response membrane protein [Actinomycetota bacterium]